jgi:hypothetical protein
MWNYKPRKQGKRKTNVETGRANKSLSVKAEENSSIFLILVSHYDNQIVLLATRVKEKCLN